ncbi:MAG: hypothetical protein ACRC2R_23520 [Xenococcaceae cyanobacterium]
MKIFVAGATGAIGRPLLDRLHGSERQLVALTRSSKKAKLLAD